MVNNDNMKKIHVFILSAILFWSCNSTPTVVSEEKAPQASVTEKIFNEQMRGSRKDAPAPSTGAAVLPEDMHKVVVRQVLPTDKYVYLNVDENGDNFWIATMKQEVNPGETVYYKGGLLKTHFESKEYHRTFDKIYLVSRIVKADHFRQVNPMKAKTMNNTSGRVEIKESIGEKIKVKGSLSIATLIANPEKYEGKKVQLSGKVVKANYNIMGRNWVHLKDGSRDDFDLVCTTDVPVPEGHVITINGVVRLNKDFGAGYVYDVIVEDAVLLKSKK